MTQDEANGQPPPEQSASRDQRADLEGTAKQPQSQDRDENGSNDDDWAELEDIDVEVDPANGDPDAEVTIDNLDIETRANQEEGADLKGASKPPQSHDSREDGSNDDVGPRT